LAVQKKLNADEKVSGEVKDSLMDSLSEIKIIIAKANKIKKKMEQCQTNQGLTFLQFKKTPIGRILSKDLDEVESKLRIIKK